MKTGRKSVFHPRETHILARSDIIILYTFFLDFEKYRVWLQHPNGLVFSFTDKHLYIAKMDQKSIFQSHEVDILAQLDIIVL